MIPRDQFTPIARAPVLDARIVVVRTEHGRLRYDIYRPS